MSSTSPVASIHPTTASLHRSLMQFDVWANDRQRIKLGEPNPDCKTCGRREFEYLDAENVEFNAVLCGRNAVQIAPPTPVTLDLEQLADRLSLTMDVKLNEYLMRFNSAEYELTVFRDGRAIIRGTDDVSVARSLYARYIGA